MMKTRMQDVLGMAIMDENGGEYNDSCWVTPEQAADNEALERIARDALGLGETLVAWWVRREEVEVYDE